MASQDPLGHLTVINGERGSPGKIGPQGSPGAERMKGEAGNEGRKERVEPHQGRLTYLRI